MPPDPLVNTIRLPSGEYDGESSATEPSVRSALFAPLASTVAIRQFAPVGQRPNTTRPPSGDQAGVSSTSDPLVSWCSAPETGSTVHRCTGWHEVPSSHLDTTIRPFEPGTTAEAGPGAARRERPPDATTAAVARR